MACTLAGALLRDAPDLVILLNPATNATRALDDVWALKESAPCTEGESNAEICFVVGRDMFTMTPGSGRFNDTHYWIMQIPKTIVNGHFDVWNPRAVALCTPFRLRGWRLTRKRRAAQRVRRTESCS